MGGRSVGGTDHFLAERKVRGGKLFRLRIELAGGRARSAVLTGDFFLEPEEGIDVIEKILVKAYSAPDSRTAERLIEDGTRGLTITGFSARDLVGALEEAGGCRGV